MEFKNGKNANPLAMERYRKAIQKAEKTYGVEIEVFVHDERHLNCLWYGGEVATIKYKGYTVTIEARGDIRLYGQYQNKDIEFVDKHDGGEAYWELGSLIDDKTLEILLNADPDTDNDYLVCENNNWFEFDLISPDGKFIDCSCYDNILSDNLFDFIDDIPYFVDVVDFMDVVDMEVADVVDAELDN